MKITKISLITILTLNFLCHFEVNAVDIQIVPADSNITINNDETEITRKDFFIFLSNLYKSNTPKTYKYINLEFIDGTTDNELKESLQILIYNDIIENKKIKIYPNKKLNAHTFYNFLDSKLDIYSEPDNESLNDLKIRNTTNKDLINAQNTIEKQKKFNKTKDNSIFSSDESNTNKEINLKKEILNDVYQTLLEGHYNNENLDKGEMLDSAIEGITKGTEDKYTTYFPPTEKKSFDESLNGKYEGIGAYVDMETPGEFKIISPITGTPAEKAGLKGGDIVVSVNGKLITSKNTVNEVVSWIKGPAGTKVKLEIKRGKNTFFVEIERAKIIIKEIDSKVINNKTYYIQIKTFGDNVKSEFEDTLNTIKNNKSIKNIIIDLRNNPGGYLDQVTDMLGFFVPLDEPTAVVKYQDYQLSYKSKGYDLIDFSKYNIILLQNSGTASASEIMIGTIKDYYPKSTIIGEKSYGKGSVQTIKSYSDGSALKYTIAKWFTGKTETTIDNTGIIPDIEEILDDEKYQKGYDSQLEKALEITNK
ncbi:MAG: S41 family peptidase [Candidatus Gracilibacteria bacterium]|nr:S41 family peptidase [Candidatus Gracilibacteria bacterium]